MAVAGGAVTPTGRVTLLTDFGTSDGFAAAMKGVIADLAPHAHLDDVSHDLPQGDVLGGAWALSRYWNRYPAGTVHLAVIDPGVGTERKALAVEADGRILVAPDNGLLSRVLDAAEHWTAVEASDPAYHGPERSRTFHGRDVFAPLAGHLARGVALDALGPPVTDPVRLGEPRPERTATGLSGRVVEVDHFGNLITNFCAEDIPDGAVVRVAGERLELSSTYGSAEPGKLLALVNSSNRLEVAVRDGSAARVLGAGRGLRVEVREFD